MSSKKYLPGPESYREFRETGPRAPDVACLKRIKYPVERKTLDSRCGNFFLTEIKDRIRKRSMTDRNVTYVGVTVRTIAVLLPDTIKYAEICLIDFVFYPSVDINIYPLNYFILIEF